MGKNDILHALQSLSPEDRSEIRAKLDELDGLSDEEWGGEFTIEQRRMILERVEEHERDPGSAIPWEVVKEEMRKRRGK